MSHHFDTPSAREDPRLSIGEFYLFQGQPGFVTFLMMVNPAAKSDTPWLFRSEALYAFRIDKDGDGIADTVFKVRIEDHVHEGDQVRPTNLLRVFRSDTSAERFGLAGSLLLEGPVETLVGNTEGVRVFAGLVHDLNLGTAAGLQKLQQGHDAGEYIEDPFEGTKAAPGTIAAIVLEIPEAMVGSGMIHAWATVSLVGHAPEQQVSRFGLPFYTYLFLKDDEDREAFNRSEPDDLQYTEIAAELIRSYASLAGATSDPGVYASAAVAKLGRACLPYEIGTPASFDMVRFNGRALLDNAKDVMLTTLVNRPLATHLLPDKKFVKSDFPYVASARS